MTHQNCILKYPGAKNRIADWICSYIPPHDVYLEPYAGSLAVLFAKKPARIETVNDLNQDVVNYFRVLRDYPNELICRIMNTPYARKEYDDAYNQTEDSVEKAVRFCIKCQMGFSCSNRYKNGFRTGQQHNSPNPAKSWSKLPDVLQMATERLKQVQIECLPALELLQRYSTPDVFAYLDPPYLRQTRTQKYLYSEEMSDLDHKELLELLLEFPGKILLSGYDNELYNTFLSGWNKVSRQTQAEGGISRTEVLWMNYEYNKQLSIFDFAL